MFFVLQCLASGVEDGGGDPFEGDYCRLSGKTSSGVKNSVTPEMNLATIFHACVTDGRFVCEPKLPDFGQWYIIPVKVARLDGEAP
jgi:hypothetical protein